MRVLLRNLALSALSLSVLTCGKKPASHQSKVQNVFGNDDRIAITESDSTSNQILKIYAQDPFSDVWSGCTGTLVGPDLLLTASHCLQDENGNLKRKVQYFPKFYNGVGTSAVVAESFWLGTTRYTQNWKDDWALVRLNIPLGETLGFMEVKNLPTSELIEMGARFRAAGHAVDFQGGGNLSMHSGCSIKEEFNGKLFTDCDFSAGASGGPVFDVVNLPYAINGLIVAESTEFNGSSYPDGIPYSHETANWLVKVSAFYDRLNELKFSTEGVKNITILKVCNSTEEPLVKFAVAYNEEVLKIKGWIEVASNACASVDLGSNQAGDVFVYGVGVDSGKILGNGTRSFCVDNDNDFELKSEGGNCNSSNYSNVSFEKIAQVEPRKLNLWRLK